MKSEKSNKKQNKVILGDCLEKLQNLKSSSVDLVYLDPPFFTQKEHSQLTRDNSEKFQFSDVWDSLESYLVMMSFALKECQRVLKNTGSIFLHCDKVASHHLRVQLDQIFGFQNFRSEIVWSYKRWSNAKKGLLNAHQTIFFYSKTEQFKFNTFYNDYSATTNVDQILQARARNTDGKSVYKRDGDGNVVMGSAKQGVPLSDVWEIPYLNPKAKERVGYPTQKPILLLQQVIQIASDQGDVVLDPFCGSGTTLVAAKLLDRNYIGIDISEDAVRLSLSRLENPVVSNSNLLSKGTKEYVTKSDKELLILKSLDAVPVQRNSGIDGFLKKTYLGKLVAVRIQKDTESLSQAKILLQKSRKAQECGLLILVKTQNKVVEEESLGFQKESDSKIVLLNSYELILQELLQKEPPQNVMAITDGKLVLQ